MNQWFQAGGTFVKFTFNEVKWEINTWHIVGFKTEDEKIYLVLTNGDEILINEVIHQDLKRAMGL